MKCKKYIILLAIIAFIFVGIFTIYKLTYHETINYVALGDSVAAGRNPYGAIDYGYTDYFKDYLYENHNLKSYINYAVSGYKITDVMNDININRKITVNDKEENIRKALRESDIVTISIGANDLISSFNISNIGSMLTNKNILYNKIDNIFTKLDELIVLVKKYAKNNIFIVGYYNPLPNLTKFTSDIDELINYSDKKYQQLSSKYDLTFVKVSDAIAKDNDYLPNPLDIHLNKKGYEVISRAIIEKLNTKSLK